MGTPPTRALVAAYLEYASLGPGYPSGGWVTPPCIWTVLSSLGEYEFFSILLDREGSGGLLLGVAIHHD